MSSIKLIPVTQKIGKSKKKSFAKEEALLRESGEPTRQSYLPEKGVSQEQITAQAEVQLAVGQNAQNGEKIERMSGLAPENLHGVLDGRGPEDELNSFIEKQNNPSNAKKELYSRNKKLKDQILVAIAKKLGIFTGVDTDEASVKAEGLSNYGVSILDQKNREQSGYSPDIGKETISGEGYTSQFIPPPGMGGTPAPPGYLQPNPGYNMGAGKHYENPGVGTNTPNPPSVHVPIPESGKSQEPPQRGEGTTGRLPNGKDVPYYGYSEPSESYARGDYYSYWHFG